MTTYEIAVLPGDGIGNEVVAEGVKVLGAAESLIPNVKFNFSHYEVGAGLYKRTKVALPNEVFQACQQADAILFGACGLPDVRRPDGAEAGNDVQLDLRTQLDLYAGVRPIKLYHGVTSALRTEGKPTIDYVILRENTEGLYASRRGGLVLHDEVAVDSSIITRRATTRIVHKAFEIAERRGGAPSDGVSRVTCVDKSNVTPGYAFFRRVFDETASSWPNIQRDYAYIDAFTLYQVLNPYFYDVVVADNMFGDITSDLAAATIGGLGMTPTADIGDKHGLFQSAHGSAPTIAGKNIANPLATILSAALMLEWLGDRDSSPTLHAASRTIEHAVEEMLVKGEVRTSDMDGNSSTSQVGDEVAKRVSAKHLQQSPQE
jgi:3-isopropylmalate dehydrogenase